MLSIQRFNVFKWALLIGTCSVAFLLAPVPAVAQEGALESLTLEELMDVRVTTVSRRAERLFDTAAAAFVLTGEELTRAHVRSLPEALRLVPGVEVAQIDSNKWAISVRGFNGPFADQLLVMIDGRTIYSQFFSGVFWDVHDLPIEDIERIEVIRGPGGSVWGANAVNGVINVITKPVADTQGAYLELGTGRNSDVGSVTARYGTTWGPNAGLRVFGRFVDRERSVGLDSRETRDAWRSARGGIRVDWRPSTRDELTLQAEVFRTDAENVSSLPTFAAPYRQLVDDESRGDGGHFIASWDRRLGDDGRVHALVNHDRLTRTSPLGDIEQSVTEARFQHEFEITNRQSLTWGVDYRAVSDRHDATALVSLVPDSRKTHLLAFYVQDRISLSDEVTVTVGAKAERNAFTGWEYLPSARAMWSPGTDDAVWFAASRAARLPARSDFDLDAIFAIFPTPGAEVPTAMRFLGNSDDLRAERLTAFELGYRRQLGARLFFDLATFWNRYDDLTGYRIVGPPTLALAPVPHVELHAMSVNAMRGTGRGFEAGATWTHASGARVTASYGYLDLAIDAEPGLVTNDGIVGRSPRHQIKARGDWIVASILRMNAAVFWVGELSEPAVDGYVRTDLGVSYRTPSALEVSAAIQNLLDGRHTEFAPTLFEVVSQSQRRGILVLTARF